jgi:uncharacterized membrane protein
LKLLNPTTTTTTSVHPHPRVMTSLGNGLSTAQALWTPSASDEVITQRDMILDYPELIAI